MHDFFPVVLQERADSLSLSRLARRGGIKRISGTIYDDARDAMVDRLKTAFLHLRIIDSVETNLRRSDPAGMRNLPGACQTPE